MAIEVNERLQVRRADCAAKIARDEAELAVDVSTVDDALRRVREGTYGMCEEFEAPDEATIDRVAGTLGLTDDALEPRGYARLVRSSGPDRMNIEVR